VAVSGSAEFLGERARLQTYDEERFAGQESALELVASHPFGIGPGQYEDVVGIAAHSTYIRALGEQGVLGLITVVTLFIVTLLMAARNAVLGRGTYGIGSAALFAAWCGILANSAFVDTLHWRHLWLLAALIWIGSMQPGQRWAAVPTRGARRDLPTRT
jgi:O-antigen ligase